MDNEKIQINLLESNFFFLKTDVLEGLTSFRGGLKGSMKETHRILPSSLLEQCSKFSEEKNEVSFVFFSFTLLNTEEAKSRFLRGKNYFPINLFYSELYLLMYLLRLGNHGSNR